MKKLLLLVASVAAIVSCSKDSLNESVLYGEDNGPLQTKAASPIIIGSSMSSVRYDNWSSSPQELEIDWYGNPVFISSTNEAYAMKTPPVYVSVGPKDEYDWFAASNHASEYVPAPNPSSYSLSDIYKIRFSKPNLPICSDPNFATSLFLYVDAGDHSLLGSLLEFDLGGNGWPVANGIYTEDTDPDGWFTNVPWDTFSQVEIDGDDIIFTFIEPYVGGDIINTTIFVEAYSN